MTTNAQFLPGDRVQSHPATDAWMSGDRFGTVLSSYRRDGAWRYLVRMDTSRRAIRFSSQNLIAD